MLGLLLSQTGLVPQAPPVGYVASVQPSAVVAFRGATSTVPRSALSSTASIFPAQLIADEDVPMSKAKAKIVAAKAAADAKNAERGYVVPEAKETQGISLKKKEDSNLSKEQKLLAEASQRGSKRPSSQRLMRPPAASGLLLWPRAALWAREEREEREPAPRGC